MPFDGSDFPPRGDQPRGGAPNDNAVSVIIIALAVVLLVMPLSLSGLVDVVRYVRGE